MTPEQQRREKEREWNRRLDTEQRAREKAHSNWMEKRIKKADEEMWKLIDKSIYKPGSGQSNNGAQPSSGGARNNLIDAMTAMGMAIVERVGPLRACGELGERVSNTPTPVKRRLAGLGAAVGIVIAVAQGSMTVYILIAACIGAVGGWLLPATLGLLLMFATLLTGLTIGLTLIGAAIACVVLVVRAFSG